MFGRKKPEDNLGPAERAMLVEAYRTVIGEIETVIARCEWFLEVSRVEYVSVEYVGPIQRTLKEEREFREQIRARIEAMPSAALNLVELKDEIDRIHNATVAADELLRNAAADASSGIILEGLAEKGRNAQD